MRKVCIIVAAIVAVLAAAAAIIVSVANYREHLWILCDKPEVHL